MDKRFSGTWHIEEMEVWSSDHLHLLGPANITFDDDGLGSFQFVAVVGFIDCQFSERNGLPLVEFSWQGNDDNDDACGRGWGIIERDSYLPKLLVLRETVNPRHLPLLCHQPSRLPLEGAGTSTTAAADRTIFLFTSTGFNGHGIWSTSIV